MMSGGVFLGKFSKASMDRVPTFCVNSLTKEYYYCTIKSIGYNMRKTLRNNHGDGMYHAAPVILAFWSDDE